MESSTLARGRKVPSAECCRSMLVIGALPNESTVSVVRPNVSEDEDSLRGARPKGSSASGVLRKGSSPPNGGKTYLVFVV